MAKTKAHATKHHATIQASTSAPKARKRRIAKNGTVAIKEIRKLQSSTNTLIPKANFTNLVREITDNIVYGFTDERRVTSAETFRWSEQALQALQSATEAELVKLMSAATDLTVLNNRITTKAEDLAAAALLVGKMDYNEIPAFQRRKLAKENESNAPINVDAAPLSVISEGNDCSESDSSDEQSS